MLFVSHAGARVFLVAACLIYSSVAGAREVRKDPRREAAKTPPAKDAAPSTAPVTPPPDLDAYADDSFGPDLSVFGLMNLAFHDFGVGGSAQFAYPLLEKGFFDDPYFLDALHIEGGIDIFHWSWDSTVNNVATKIKLTNFAPSVGLRYLLYLTDRLALQVSGKLGMGISMASGMDDGVNFYWSASLGAMFDLADWVAVRADFGWCRYRDFTRFGFLFRF